MSVGVEGDLERAPNIAFLLVCQRGSPTSYFPLSRFSILHWPHKHLSMCFDVAYFK